MVSGDDLLVNIWWATCCAVTHSEVYGVDLSWDLRRLASINDGIVCRLAFEGKQLKHVETHGAMHWSRHSKTYQPLQVKRLGASVDLEPALHIQLLDQYLICFCCRLLCNIHICSNGVVLPWLFPSGSRVEYEEALYPRSLSYADESICCTNLKTFNHGTMLLSSQHCRLVNCFPES